MTADAGSAEQWRNKGNERLAAGDLRGAADCYSAGLRADVGDAACWLNLGFVLLEAGDPAKARDSLERALEAIPPGGDFAADAHFLTARAARQLGRLEEAAHAYKQAMGVRPHFAEACQELAQLQMERGRPTEAMPWLRHLLSLGPDVPAGLLLARLLFEARDFQPALSVLDQVLTVDPANVEALEGLGKILSELGRTAESLARFEEVLQRGGQSAHALSNLSSALQRVGRLDEALRYNHRALQLDPQHRAALYNRGAMLLEQLDLDECLRVTEAALRVYPDDPDLRWNIAQVHLMRGNFADGLPAYETRWHATACGQRMVMPDFGAVRWTGSESLAGKSILLIAEQGLGDIVQFVRYVAPIAAGAGKVFVQMPRTLASLLKDLPPNCSLLAPEQGVRADFACPLLSLPLALGTRPETIPNDVPYLRADSSDIAKWGDRLGPRTRPRLGVVWSGNANHSNDRNRSMALSTLRQIATPQWEFVSLQSEIRPSDREALTGWSELMNPAAQLRDFGDTAALVANLDLVISVDTSVAHLAGALGKPVWILIPFRPDWRWLLDRSDSPWYPSARLFRQDESRSWPAVLKQVSAELTRFANHLTRNEPL